MSNPSVSSVDTPQRPAVRSLADLVGPPREFLDDVWGVFPRQYRAETAAGLLTSRRIWDELDCGLVVRPFVRLVAAGDPVPYEEFCHTRNVVNNPLVGYPDAVVVRHRHDGGATVVLDRPERWSTDVADLVAGLASFFRAEVWSTAFLTPPGAAADLAADPAAHCFVVQLEGATSWSLASTLGDEREAVPGGLAAPTLRPGDVLYLPAGTTGGATAGDNGALHLVVGVREVAARRLAELMLAVFLKGPVAEAAAVDHHTMTLDEKVSWLRGALREHLAGLDLGKVVELARRQQGR
ncbi:JmjC domain-containing protein [Micromonospora sp. CPCC 205561]|uniref:JmjC domain-containing protein n=1 Tax=Micromonospora sp. CPCC 205561 TaxID=3122407 RepID=UPI002FF408CF